MYSRAELSGGGPPVMVVSRCRRMQVLRTDKALSPGAVVWRGASASCISVNGHLWSAYAIYGLIWQAGSLQGEPSERW